MEGGIQLKSGKHLRVPQVRPSVLDVGQRGDTWVGKCSHPDLLVVYLNNQPVNLIPGTRLDQAILNQLIYSLHHRLPRRRGGDFT